MLGWDQGRVPGGSLLNWAPKVEQEFAGQEKRQREEDGHRLDEMWSVLAQGVHWAAKEVMRAKGQGLVASTHRAFKGECLRKRTLEGGNLSPWGWPTGSG